ncbi:hypothetical protein [Mycobacteroides salmoniphilum]|nr:hypothetical protein [Mycobacteroides salmoniphilum]
MTPGVWTFGVDPSRGDAGGGIVTGYTEGAVALGFQLLLLALW